MKQLQHPYRLFPCGFSLLVALGSLLLILNHLQAEQTQAQSLEPPPNTSNNIPLRWLEFPVVTGTVRAINVHKNTILWSHYANLWGFECDDYVPYPPPEQHKEKNIVQAIHIPEEVWAICLYNSLDGSLKMLGSGGDLDYPDMYGDWVVMDRNRYIGTLRAENIVTGEERDIWYKDYEVRSAPYIDQDIVVASPDNHSLIAYNLVTQVMTSVTYLDDYPDYWGFSGHVEGSQVVWIQPTASNPDFGILGFDLQTQSPYTVTDLPGHEFIADFHQYTVYWRHYQDLELIYAENVLTGELFYLNPDGFQYIVEVSGDWMAWTDDRHGAPDLRDVYVYNLVTEQEYRITQESDRIDWLGFDGNLVAWGITTDQGTRIRAAKLLSYAAFLPLLQR